MKTTNLTYVVSNSDVPNASDAHCLELHIVATGPTPIQALNHVMDMAEDLLSDPTYDQKHRAPDEFWPQHLTEKQEEQALPIEETLRQAQARADWNEKRWRTSAACYAVERTKRQDCETMLQAMAKNFEAVSASLHRGDSPMEITVMCSAVAAALRSPGRR